MPFDLDLETGEKNAFGPQTSLTSGGLEPLVSSGGQGDSVRRSSCDIHLLSRLPQDINACFVVLPTVIAGGRARVVALRLRGQRY
jgi:hypothetical protein